MKSVFADTFYFLALVNPKDPAHAKALEFSESRTGPLVTTTWVLTEVANSLAGTRNRPLFSAILESLNGSPDDSIVPCSPELFDRGVELYNARPDKEWSLTDSISFLVMEKAGIAEALTGDHHFEQAGFIALLK